MPNIIITGASRGIGKAIALKFVKEGWNAAVCSRNEAEIEELKRELLDLSSTARVIAAKADMSKKEEAVAFGEKIKTAFSTIDILVNNAGIYLPGTVHEEPEGQLEIMMATNLYGAYYLTRSLLPAMKAQKKGHIFNMCSTASLKAYPNGGSYSISKFALLGFSKNLREELKRWQIKVTAICPGPTLTASWEGFDAPSDRFMTAGDIAGVIWDTYHLSAQTVVEEILLRPVQGDIGDDFN